MTARVLLIEDNRPSLELMTYLLRAFGHTPLEASNGVDGLEVLRRERPDLVVCDIDLPRLDGFSLAGMIKADPDLRDPDGRRDRAGDGRRPRPCPPLRIRRLHSQTDRSRGLRPGDRGASCPRVRVRRSEVSRMATILVVDDRPVDREFLAKLLGYGGHVVLEAADGEEALAVVRASRPDLIIADILMPRMDGFRLVRELRSDPDLASIVVLIYSASYDSLDVRELTTGYGIQVLNRPSEPEAILDEVREALSGPAPEPALPPSDYDRQHLRLLGDKLYQKTLALEESNRQLTRLVAELRDEVENRRRAEAEAAEGREWLRVVLTSIGDAVIATDAKGRVSFLNATAATMTGWDPSEATGRLLDEVFHIINEDHRRTVESPVERVLREGIIVGLANHTVLVGRDGTKRPIDDCAAPIRDADGRIRGVVLVFHDVSERRELERQLRDRAERLAEADRRKDEFLAMLAHELRNPLAPIRNSLYVLEVSPDDRQVVAEMRDIIGVRSRTWPAWSTTCSTSPGSPEG